MTKSLFAILSAAASFPMSPPGQPFPSMYNGSMDRHGRAREKMEKAYGEVGSGAATLVVRGVTYRLREILSRWMMDVPEIMTLDAGILGEDRFFLRFIDKDDRCYVAFEFNGEFDILSEMRADSLLWEGKNFFASRWR
jgi:hypothetical protein